MEHLQRPLATHLTHRKKIQSLFSPTNLRVQYGTAGTLVTMTAYTPYRLDTTVRHGYNETRRYMPCLVAINQYNCPDTACQNLTAIVNPLLDVPNAFTPNGDGANDRAVVIGYGITKLTFRIYNRWGQLMFETTNRKLGWDGRFNGKPATNGCICLHTGSRIF